MILLQAAIGVGIVLFPIVVINYILWTFVLIWLNKKGWIPIKREAYLYLLSIILTILSIYGIYIYLTHTDFLKYS